MPIRDLGDGRYKYGDTGKVYRSRAKAVKQMRAIKASQARRKKHADKKS